jgi:glycosyltransferase involved in cell wall biosynthesis
MRILLSTLTPYPSGTAHVVHITATAQGFVDAGHDVVLVAAQPGPGWPDGTTPVGIASAVHTLAGRDHRGQSFVNGLRLRHLARSMRPDLCFADDVRSGLALAAGGAPVIVELHSMQFHASRISRAALRRLIAHPRLCGLVTISGALRDDLVATGDVPGTSVTVAPEAARPRSDDELAAAAPGWLRTLPRPGALQVGYTGSLYAGRGVALMSELARRLPHIDLHVLGGPTSEADLLRARHDRPSNLHVHGLRPVADAERLQAAMDVLLAPYSSTLTTPGGVDTSRWMSPMKVFEYLAAGRPMVCADLPVLREVLIDGTTALLAPPDDADAWAAAVGRLATDPELRGRIGAAARETHATRFTWEARTATLLGLASSDAQRGPVG